MRFFIILFVLLLTSKIANSQCTISTSSTDINCNGLSTGSVTATITNQEVNNCGVPASSPETCPGTNCTASVTTNTSVTVSSGKTCLNYTGGTFSESINVSGGTLVICGTVTPSSFVQTGGTVIINGSLTLNGGLVLYAGTNLSNYGSLTVNNGFSVLGTFNNQGTAIINSGTVQVYGTGNLVNGNTMTIYPGLDVVGSLINNNLLTIYGNLQGYNGSTLTNNCTFNIFNNFLNSTTSFVNNGKTTVSGTFTQYSGSNVTMNGGSTFTSATYSLQGASITSSGTGCSLFKVNGDATIYNGSTVSTSVSLCVTGATTNMAGLGSDVLNCNCNLAASANCTTYNWKNSLNVEVGNTSTVSNLPAGTYTVTATCSNCANSPLSETATIIQPTVISFSTTSTNVSCNGGADGSITVTASGGTGTKQYSNDNGVTYQSSNIFSGLAATTYQVIVKDANDCVSLAQSVTIQPAALAVSTTQTNVSCNGGNNGSITITANSGTGPYTYSIDNGVNFYSSNVFINLIAGNYNVIVKDVNNCTSIAQNSTVVEPLLLSAIASVNGTTAQIATSGGTSPYSYTWSNGTSGSLQSNLAVGTYTVIVADANNCSTDVTVIIGSSQHVYYAVARKLDGGFYNTIQGVLHFSFVEEYADNETLTFRILDRNREVRVSNSNYHAPPAKKFGNNFLDLDLTFCPYGLIDGDYYILEVISDKNETYVLRFKYIKPVSAPSCN